MVYGRSFDSTWYGFGGTDYVRAKDIMICLQIQILMRFCDKRWDMEVIRMIDKLDYDVIKKNPKIISGFSDITTLQCQ